MDENEVEALHFAVRGFVQGVHFRASMVQEARRLGVTGWVRNRRDGSVEAYAVGRPAALDALATWAERGPAAARVDECIVTPAEADRSLTGFVQAPTA
ncbi:acylphosphatase [Methyloversatilis thermotolerans]|uniref:acylphosphatase n=1 Tax=Methyloversatilis thermotolerans TaxID=1346290 RepID=UPI00036510B1|nr:acylphosphatase [Methyloversatilis thermotolerans]